MSNKILDILTTLREYALGKGYEISIFLQEEESFLMRFANSAISLNTNEHLIRMDFTAHEDRKRASYALITDLGKLEEMKSGIDTAAEMVKHAQPLEYQPTVPVYEADFIEETYYDPSLAAISNEEKLAFFNEAVKGMESDDLKLSGIFSNGSNIIAMTNTRSKHCQYFRTSDAQVTIVLAHEKLKWEVQSEQSAQQKSDLNAAELHEELALLLKHYQEDKAVQLPLGEYDVVFAPAATAEMATFMKWIGYNGGLMKRGFSFLKEDSVGKKVFSEQITISDDATDRRTFPFGQDIMGIPRAKYPLFEAGVFKGFTWFQDDADEFGAKATGHTVMHNSMAFAGGSQKINSLKELLESPRDKDILYVPFLHYMNIVNPTSGIVTATTRFGALLLKKDGTIDVPYNVRLTQPLQEVFGDKVEWLSTETVPYNTSQSYGARNPVAIVVPRFMKVKNLAISHSNSSY